MGPFAAGDNRLQGPSAIPAQRKVIAVSGYSKLMKDTPLNSVAEMAARTPYPPEAFAFVREALYLAAVHEHGPEPEMANPALLGRRHVTGQQLCEALRNLAIQRWGFLARLVLSSWNIHSTLDFGKIVYAMIDNELMQKTEGDSLEDFRDVFDFGSALRVSTEFELKE